MNLRDQIRDRRSQKLEKLQAEDPKASIDEYRISIGLQRIGDKD